MYTTMKIRLRMKEDKKTFLLNYERLFHEEMDGLSKQIETNRCNFRDYCFHTDIHPKCHWMLRQLALKQYQAKIHNRSFTYSRSSSWAVGSFTFDGNNLDLFFGFTSSITKLRVELIMDEQEKAFILLKKIIRIDLVHDEKFWYVNFILFSDNA